MLETHNALDNELKLKKKYGDNKWEKLFLKVMHFFLKLQNVSNF